MSLHRHRAVSRSDIPIPRPLAKRLVGLLTVVVGVAGVGVAAVAGARAVLASGGCARTVTVRVAATRELEPVVRAAGRPLGYEPDGHRRCVLVDVRTQAAADLAAEIGRAGNGLGLDLPDVWIPDSSLWLAPARRLDTGAHRVRSVGGSVAVSPIVVATSRKAALAAGWPGRQPNWRTLTAVPGTGPGLADPRRSSAGLAALLAGAGDAGQDGRYDLARVSAFARDVVVPRLGDESGSATDVLGTQGVGAIPTGEFDVVLHDRSTGDLRWKLAAVYDSAVPGVLDYPFVRVDSGRPDAAPGWAVAWLQSALHGPRAREALARQGLRTPDGAPLPGTDAADRNALGALPVRTVRSSPPADEEVRGALASWNRLGRRPRALLVVDVSGSMAEPMPGSTRSRMHLATEALAAAVTTSTPDAELGLWSFSSAAGGSAGHHRLVGTGPIYANVGGGVTRRTALLAAIRRLAPDPAGNTDLYGTTLAAFRSAEADYDFGRLNSVIVITDGRNEDPGGITLAALMRRLRLEFDGVKPVRVITLAYGRYADSASLIQISDVTGGRSYRAVTAARVPEMFREVLQDL